MADRPLLYGPQGAPIAFDVQQERVQVPPGAKVRQLSPEGTMSAIVAASNHGMDPYNEFGRPFSPSRPLIPTTHGKEPIVWPPYVGYNLSYAPEKKPGIPNNLLRLFADRCTPIGVVIDQIKREMRGYSIDITPANAKAKKVKDDSPERERLRDWLKKPDGRLDFESWQNSVLEDMLIIGAPAIFRLYKVNGQAGGLRPIDASLVVPIVTASGIEPEPPLAAYYYAAYGLPYEEYTTDELLYLPFNRRTHTPYGFGPVERCMLYVMLALHRGIFYTNFYTEGTIPSGFATLPENWTDQQVLDFGTKWNDLFSGNTGQRHKVPWAPYGSTFQTIKSAPDWDYSFDEFLLRVFAWAIGVAATPIVKQSSLGQGSEGLTQEALAAGSLPLMKFIQRILTDYIQGEGEGETADGEKVPLGLGAPDWQFEYVATREENKQQKLLEAVQRQENGQITINDIKASYGEDPYDEDEYPMANVPMMKTATGWTPLDQVGKEPEPVPPGLGGPPGPPGVGPDGTPVAPGQEGTPTDTSEGTPPQGKGKEIPPKPGTPKPPPPKGGAPAKGKEESEDEEEPKGKEKDSKKAAGIASDTSGYRLWQLGTHAGGLVIWLVDGDKIRRNLNIDFAQGTNEFAPVGSGVVPSGEIWIDDATPPSEWAFVILHELEERKLMEGGASYDDAHARANIKEQRARLAAGGSDKVAKDAEWDEEKHPRSATGQFSEATESGSVDTKVMDGTFILSFHGTSKSAASSILSGGVQARDGNSLGYGAGRPDSVYFTTEMDQAMSYGTGAAMAAGADRFGVVEIAVPFEQWRSVIFDKEDAEAFGTEHNYRIERDVPPEWVVGVRWFDAKTGQEVEYTRQTLRKGEFAGGTAYVVILADEKTTKAEWSEELHPRDDAGKFTDSGGKSEMKSEVGPDGKVHEWDAGRLKRAAQDIDKRWSEVLTQNSEEKFALHNYKTDFREVQKGLRNGATSGTLDDVKERMMIINGTTSFINKSETPEAMVVYRANSGLGRLKVGDVITDQGFVSTTRDEHYARAIGKGVIEIRLPKGAKAIPMDRYARLVKEVGKEAEILVQRGSSFRVVSAAPNHRVLEYLGSKPMSTKATLAYGGNIYRSGWAAWKDKG